MSVQEITLESSVKLLNQQESIYLDYKASEIAPAKLSRSISAFANTAGGEIFIGVKEVTISTVEKRFEWKGFSKQEDANDIFQVLHAASNREYYRYSFLSCQEQDGLILHLTIFKTPNIINATDGFPYLRKNAQNIKVEGTDGLRQLSLDKGVFSYEDDKVQSNLNVVSNSETLIRFLLEIVPSAEPESWLSKQKLSIDNAPTVAGVLLFSDEPQAHLPKRSAIKIYRYKTKDTVGSRELLAFDPITIEGSLYTLIKDAVETTKRLIEEISIMSPLGLERIHYPDETLHEVITNAVLHRDYSIAADVHVRIFDNRVEVESPGRLPGHITVKNILNEQSARNPKIVRLINKFPNPPNKDVGEGLNTAFEAMKKLKLQYPEIVEKESSVVVYIRHTPLSSPHEMIMAHLEENGEINNSTARELTGIGSENRVKAIFLDMKESKMIEPVPGKKGKASAWQKYTGMTFGAISDTKEDFGDLFSKASEEE